MARIRQVCSEQLLAIVLILTLVATSCLGNVMATPVTGLRAQSQNVDIWAAIDADVLPSYFGVMENLLQIPCSPLGENDEPSPSPLWPLGEARDLAIFIFQSQLSGPPARSLSAGLLEVLDEGPDGSTLKFQDGATTFSPSMFDVLDKGVDKNELTELFNDITDAVQSSVSYTVASGGAYLGPVDEAQTLAEAKAELARVSAAFESTDYADMGRWLLRSSSRQGDEFLLHAASEWPRLFHAVDGIQLAAGASTETATMMFDIAGAEVPATVKTRHQSTLSPGGCAVFTVDSVSDHVDGEEQVRDSIMIVQDPSTRQTLAALTTRLLGSDLFRSSVIVDVTDRFPNE